MSFANKIARRLPGGIYLRTLQEIDACNVARFGADVAKRQKRRILLLWLFGSRARRLLDRKPWRKDVSGSVGKLYHLTSRERMDSIREQGLIPGKKGVVFLTDVFEGVWFEEFLDWKRWNSCQLVEVDADALVQTGHRVYITDRCHEFATDVVPTSCLGQWSRVEWVHEREARPDKPPTERPTDDRHPQA